MPIVYNEISDTLSSLTHENLNCSYLIWGLNPSLMFLMCMDGPWLWKYISLFAEHKEIPDKEL